jgi:hypothetical protein
VNRGIGCYGGHGRKSLSNSPFMKGGVREGFGEKEDLKEEDYVK